MLVCGVEEADDLSSEVGVLAGCHGGDVCKAVWSGGFGGGGEAEEV